MSLAIVTIPLITDTYNISMQTLLPRLLLILMPIVIIVGCSNEPEIQAQTLENPKNKTIDHSYQLNGISISDPYHWIESNDTEQVKTWIAEQKELTNLYFAQDAFEDYVDDQAESAAINNLVWGTKFNYFYFIGLYSESANSKDWKLVRFNSLKNTFLTYELNLKSDEHIKQFKLSPDSRFIALLIESSSNRFQWRIYDTAKQDYFKRNLPVLNSATNFQWLNQKEFLYSSKDTVFISNILYSSNLDISILNKQELYEKSTNKNTSTINESILSAQLSTDNQYLIVHEIRTNKPSRFWTKSYQAEQNKVQPLIDGINSDFKYIANLGMKIYFLTNFSASRNRIISIDLEKPARRYWKEVIAQNKNLLIDAQLINNQWLLSYKENTKAKLYLSKLNGQNIELINTNKNSDYQILTGEETLGKNTFLIQSNILNSSQLVKLNTKNNELESAIDVAKLAFSDETFFSDNELKSQVHFFRSNDGSRVPITLFSKGKVKKSSAFLLVANNGEKDLFHNKSDSFFSNFILNGGTLAVVHARGGLTYGNSWYQTAKGKNRVKIIEDIISAQNWLFDKNYTTPKKLAIYANKNNAESFALFLNHPEADIKVAIFTEGNFDLLSKANNLTDSKESLLWQDKFSYSPNQKSTRQLLKLDPTITIRVKKYPATLLVSSPNDPDQLKYLAKLQNHQAASNPILWLDAEENLSFDKTLFFLKQQLEL